jgi:hypothetical protein
MKRFDGSIPTPMFEIPTLIKKELFRIFETDFYLNCPDGSYWAFFCGTKGTDIVDTYLFRPAWEGTKLHVRFIGRSKRDDEIIRRECEFSFDPAIIKNMHELFMLTKPKFIRR